MKIKWLHLILLTLIFSENAQARNDPRPGSHKISKTPQDYYKNSFGYNTKDPCTGDMCFSVGSKISCSKYTYIKNNTAGTETQFCNISKVESDNSITSYKEEDNYTMFTGFINKEGDFSADAPANEYFNIDIKGNIIPYKPSKPDTIKTEAEAKPCDENCGPSSGTNKATDLARVVIEAITPVAPAPAALKKQIGNAYKAHSGKLGFAASCSNFIDADGDIGPRGTKVINAIKKVGSECFDGKINVSSVCPKFKNLSKKQKEYFWIWTYASMAQEESTCGMRLTNTRATNGTAFGLLQMEGRHWRRKNGRDKKFCPHHEINNNDETFQIECSTSILKETTCKFGWPLSSGSGYWAELRGANNAISRHIKKFPGCY